MRRATVPWRAPQVKELPGASELDHEELERRASCHYLNRGCVDGLALEDWLAAETELRDETQGNASAGEPAAAAALVFDSSSPCQLAFSDLHRPSGRGPGQVLGSQNAEYLVRNRSAYPQHPAQFFHELTLRRAQSAICQQHVDSDSERRAPKRGWQVFGRSGNC